MGNHIYNSTVYYHYNKGMGSVCMSENYWKINYNWNDVYN